VNGIVRTMTMAIANLGRTGQPVEPITPDSFAAVPCPSYREIRPALSIGPGVKRRSEAFAPLQSIATQGLLGWRHGATQGAVPRRTA